MMNCVIVVGGAEMKRMPHGWFDHRLCSRRVSAARLGTGGFAMGFALDGGALDK